MERGFGVVRLKNQLREMKAERPGEKKVREKVGRDASVTIRGQT